MPEPADPPSPPAPPPPPAPRGPPPPAAAPAPAVEGVRREFPQPDVRGGGVSLFGVPGARPAGTGSGGACGSACGRAGTGAVLTGESSVVAVIPADAVI